jgi:hypothetical protein
MSPTSPAIGPSQASAPRRRRSPLLDSEASVAKAIERALDKPWLELDLGVRLEAIEFHCHF